MYNTLRFIASLKAVDAGAVSPARDRGSKPDLRPVQRGTQHPARSTGMALLRIILS
jgi:hypothetical protein